MASGKGIYDEPEIGKGKFPIIERVVLDFVNACRDAMASNEIQKYCNLVELFKLSFPYSNNDSNAEFAGIETWFKREQITNERTQGNKQDPVLLHLRYEMMKYGAIIRLLKAKNIYPRPAETTVW